MQPDAFLVPSEQRLILWKEFRESLADKNYEEQISSVVTWFSKVPTVNISIDCYDSSTWPTAWELMDDGKLCDSAIALMMEQTLYWSSEQWQNERLQLLLIENKSDEILRLCLLIDNKYLLNYSYSEIIDWNNICNRCIIHAKFMFKENDHLAVI